MKARLVGFENVAPAAPAAVKAEKPYIMAAERLSDGRIVARVFLPAGSRGQEAWDASECFAVFPSAESFKRSTVAGPDGTLVVTAGGAFLPKRVKRDTLAVYGQEPVASAVVRLLK